MALKNPDLPRARIITSMGPPFWVVFDGPVYRGYGSIGAIDCGLEAAYYSWVSKQMSLYYRSLNEAEERAMASAQQPLPFPHFPQPLLAQPADMDFASMS